MKLRTLFSHALMYVALMCCALAWTRADAAGIAEAFKDLDAEIRASVVKEMIRARAYDLEYTQRRPKEKGSKGDDKSKGNDLNGAMDQLNSASGGRTGGRSRDGGQSSLDRLEESFNEDDDYDRPVREKVCSMEVASQKKDPGKPAPRRQTIVITDPIIQICK
jgi:hypothetical protein